MSVRDGVGVGEIGGVGSFNGVGDIGNVDNVSGVGNVAKALLSSLKRCRILDCSHFIKQTKNTYFIGIFT